MKMLCVLLFAVSLFSCKSTDEQRLDELSRQFKAEVKAVKNFQDLKELTKGTSNSVDAEIQEKKHFELSQSLYREYDSLLKIVHNK